ncbi:hypothetical protein StoSoilB13_28130 (plasmid) [Arthrobacter sp. StoSoilB13]|nr:hypothetical protein StoSoilB13_28130 [Arthrobacter sp. StoSoilB13]
MGEGVEYGYDAGAGRGVEVSKRLVNQEQGRALHHGGGDCHKRCFAGREGVEVPVQERRHSNPLRDLHRAGPGDGGCNAAQFKGKRDFVSYAGAGEGRARVLQDNAYDAGSIARRCSGTVHSGDTDRASEFSAVDV